nr:hypothetical protein Itr_chr14CG14870 [Ipomoea trifida]
MGKKMAMARGGLPSSSTTTATMGQATTVANVEIDDWLGGDDGISTRQSIVALGVATVADNDARRRPGRELRHWHWA